mgnify:CR=1 FL=1
MGKEEWTQLKMSKDADRLNQKLAVRRKEKGLDINEYESSDRYKQF